MEKYLYLYRNILREHRKRLPVQMRIIGDGYVKNEFRLHYKAKQDHLIPFYEAWEQYLLDLQSRKLIFSDVDSDASSGLISLNTDQQKILSDLKHEIDRLNNDKRITKKGSKLDKMAISSFSNEE